MIDISNVIVCGFEPAIRGMRNSYSNWNDSDTSFQIMATNFVINDDDDSYPYIGNLIKVYDMPIVGLQDYNLIKRLIKAGGPEAKFRRMIQAWMDIYAPLTWWKQFDTYKVGTTANSTSTMHTITKRDKFDIHDFSFHSSISKAHIAESVDKLNELLALYKRYKESNEDPKLVNDVWQTIIDVLPESFLQLRTVNLNYEVLSQIYKWRKNHKEEEWREFCTYIEHMPESWIITGESES